MAYSQIALASGDGLPLCLHAWKPSFPEAVLFYVHGIQSHGGWLFETGPFLAGRGIAVYALDRRGSGRSGGGRGHLQSAASVLDDYGFAWDRVRAGHPGLPISALGQSLGGGILAALAVEGRISGADALLFCAPALGQMHSRLDAGERRRILAEADAIPVPVSLDDRDYTDQAAYLEFMERDPLMLRTVTRATRAAMLGFEEIYLGREGALAGEKVHFARPRRDRILDLEVSRLALGRLAGPGMAIHDFPAESHYLEFSPCRQQYREWLSELAMAPLGDCP
jgi:alpha-beta hydrolase superfamily lysophospholipase